MQSINEIEELVKLISRLPGLGPKSATMSICPPEGVNFTAFDNKLINICLMRRSSAIIRRLGCLSVWK